MKCVDSFRHLQMVYIMTKTSRLLKSPKHLKSFIVDHDVAKGRKREDFTMIKAILQNVTFKQDFKNVESEIYLEIRSQLVSLINSINEITNQSLLSAEVFQMALYKTEDCFVKFILYIPWKSSDVGTIGGIFFDLSK